jgi:hypothetical protein
MSGTISSSEGMKPTEDLENFIMVIIQIDLSQQKMLS